MSIDYFFTWLMILFRAMGVVIQFPALAGRPLPATVRVALGIGLATLLAGIVPSGPAVLGLWPLVTAVLMETMIGFGLGFVAHMVFSAVETAGRMISTEIGLSATPG